MEHSDVVAAAVSGIGDRMLAQHGKEMAELRALILESALGKATLAAGTEVANMTRPAVQS